MSTLLFLCYLCLVFEQKGDCREVTISQSKFFADGVSQGEASSCVTLVLFFVCEIGTYATLSETPTKVHIEKKKEKNICAVKTKLRLFQTFHVAR